MYITFAREAIPIRFRRNRTRSLLKQNTLKQPGNVRTGRNLNFLFGKMQRAFLMEKLGQKTFYLSEDVNFWAADLSITNKKDFLIKNQSLKELSLINTYRANRMSRNLPIRGQRTHTNAKTRRKRKTN
jgi:uncharacterized protein YqjF (DUF2071 family)